MSVLQANTVGRVVFGGWLLDNPLKNVIDRIMNPGTLLFGALLLIVAIALVVSAIFIYLYFKKRSFLYTERIREYLEVWIAQIITDEAVESLEIPRRFYRVLNNGAARQFAINQLVLCKKNFSGAVSDNITALYVRLGLKAHSLKKLKEKRHWHIQARGIQELYLMDQRDCLRKIYKQTNSEYEFVRLVAQNGIIHLTGFPGLRFLDVVSQPLSEWHQLKLIEQLKFHTPGEDFADNISKWLQSKNETVVVLALKLASDYQLYAVRPFVIDALVHSHDSVRSQALKTLVRLADEFTPSLLLGYFAKESEMNQAFILNALRNLATEKEQAFLERLLDHKSDTIKLKAGIVLAECTSGGLALLEKKGREQPEPYQRIYQHAKTVK